MVLCVCIGNYTRETASATLLGASTSIYQVLLLLFLFRRRRLLLLRFLLDDVVVVVLLLLGITGQESS